MPARTAITAPRLSGTRPILQAALADIRSIVSGLNGETATLDWVLAEARHEAARRFEAAGIALDWPAPDALAERIVIDYRQSKALLSSVREIVSNIIRHADARGVRFSMMLSDQAMSLRVADDGRGMPLETGSPGHGLGNIRHRIEGVGGSLTITSSTAGTALDIAMPLEPTWQSRSA